VARLAAFADTCCACSHCCRGLLETRRRSLPAPWVSQRMRTVPMSVPINALTALAFQRHAHRTTNGQACALTLGQSHRLFEPQER